MFNRKIIAILTSLLLSTTPAFAFTGEQLLEMLKKAASSSQQERYSYAAGSGLSYVSGIFALTSRLKMQCYDDSGISSQKMGAIVRNYINRNPGEWNMPADIVVVKALKDFYPCADN